MSKIDEDNTDEDKEMHHLTLYVVKGITGVYVGHVKEMPEIVTQSDTVKGLEDESTKSVLVYWTHFPEVHDKLFPHHVSAVQQQNKLGTPKLQYNKIELTVPSF